MNIKKHYFKRFKKLFITFEVIESWYERHFRQLMGLFKWSDALVIASFSAPSIKRNGLYGLSSVVWPLKINLEMKKMNHFQKLSLKKVFTLELQVLIVYLLPNYFLVHRWRLWSYVLPKKETFNLCKDVHEGKSYFEKKSFKNLLQTLKALYAYYMNRIQTARSVMLNLFFNQLFFT